MKDENLPYAQIFLNLYSIPALQCKAAFYFKKVQSIEDFHPSFLIFNFSLLIYFRF